MNLETYLALRALHLISYAVFLGSVATLMAFKVVVDKNVCRQAISDNVTLMLRLDRIVTAPAALVLGLTGAALAASRGASGAAELWIVLLVFGWVLGFSVAHFWSIPLLKRLEACASDIRHTGDCYATVSKKWLLCNALLLSLLAGTSVIAVYRPDLAYVRQLLFG